MSEREALELVRALLGEALDVEPGPTRFPRDLNARIGELSQAMRAALTVIDRALPGADR
ncbi:hypothetical protein FNQ90_05250 [Streptomyces alkaliphilus]|uniref:Uncharacterized protein n=1 Tax=Streptomyces alkaliphilus TaxID=1472722 RepID=A0A7W3TAZ3_9ACTN|nr:hypothetical protein [Streptomyces alkaliphilus]MBB0243528.1 hypothetical protein [Streptomyces alkaliphilus]